MEHCEQGVALISKDDISYYCPMFRHPTYYSIECIAGEKLVCKLGNIENLAPLHELYLAGKKTTGDRMFQ